MGTLLRSIEAHHLLLVEGSEDKQFWEQYLSGVKKSYIDVRETGGKDQLRRLLPTLVLASGFDKVSWLGVIQDADDNPRAAFDRITGALRLAGLSVPTRPWVTVSGSPDVVAFVVPDGSSSGDLETLLWRGLASQPEASCIEQYINCLESLRGAPVSKESKARVYAYIAAQRQPDARLAHSMLQNHVNNPDLQRLVNMLP